MEKARSIVNAIAEEIEARAYDRPFDESLLSRFHEKQREIEDRVTLDFSKEIPPSALAAIKKILGEEVLDCIESKSGSLVRKNRDKVWKAFKNIAALIERYRFYVKEAQTLEIRKLSLEQIRRELIDSQVAHVHELEVLEERLQIHRLLESMMLTPFETAMKTAMTYLQAGQVEIFLFDDDKFLAAELKTDGEAFTYNTTEEPPAVLESVSRITLQEVQETKLEVPLVVEDQQIGHYTIRRQITGDFDKDAWQQTVERITPVLARIIESNRNRIQAEKVHIDDLTQLYNKRKLNEQMGKLFKQFKSGQKKLLIAMLDIDRFKALNDTYGHPVGDHILKKTAAIIKKNVPYAYRYGGEEFVAVYYGFTRDVVMESMERLRLEIESTPFRISGRDYRITISSGVAEFETHMNSVMDAIDHADKALYASKEDGRNRCTYYGDVKDRLSADTEKLRKEVLLLKEENRRLAAQIQRSGSKKKRAAESGRQNNSGSL